MHSQYAAQGPDVHLEAVALLAQHLRCDVVGRPAQRLLPLAVKLDLSGQTKVPWERPWRLVELPASGLGFRDAHRHTWPPFEQVGN